MAQAVLMQPRFRKGSSFSVKHQINFRFLRPDGLCHNCSTLSLLYKSHYRHGSKWEWLCSSVTLYDNGARHVGIKGKSFPDRGNRECKGIGIGACLECSKISKQALQIPWCSCKVEWAGVSRRYGQIRGLLKQSKNIRFHSVCRKSRKDLEKKSGVVRLKF